MTAGQEVASQGDTLDADEVIGSGAICHTTSDVLQTAQLCSKPEDLSPHHSI